VLQEKRHLYIERSCMKKYFKLGLGLLIPILLVLQVLVWAYNFFYNITIEYLPETIEYQWWFVVIALLAAVIFVFIIGLLFSLFAPLRWMKQRFDKHVINRIPVVNKIYNFGKDISDSFISDIKEDGDLQVVEVDFGGMKMLGVLTDPKNNIVFVLSSPSPLTGFTFKTEKYTKLDISFMDAVQINTSLGRINGHKWK
ncbi:MAG: DUF502 domain-containing protein, partial [Acholeplasmataceae bacterium]